MASAKKKKNPVIQGSLYALSGFAVFALHDATIKSLSEYSIFQIIFFAVLFSYVPFSFSLAADKRARNLRPVNPGWLLVRTLCMVGATASVFFAFRSLPLTQAYALLFATPIFITVLAIPILGETVRLLRWIAIGLGMIGVLIVLQPTGEQLGYGHLAALVAVACSSLTATITRRIGSSERSATLILYPLLANIVVAASTLYFVYRPMPFVDLAKMAGIGMLAMLGQYLIITAYRSAPAAFVAPFQYSQMLWAIFYGYFWFGEIPKSNVYLGASVIILAGLLIVWRESSTGVSANRPFLKTRNIRAVSAAPMRSVECDEAPEAAQADTIDKTTPNNSP